MKELREKALGVSKALRSAGVPHAVIGGLAVAAHVARVDETAQRNTQDLDILLERGDLDRATAALSPLGYKFRKVMRLHAFMPRRKGAKFGEGVLVIFAGEKVRDEYVAPAPHLQKDGVYVAVDGVCYLGLPELLTMKLTSFRLKDKVHVQDLLQQRLITKKIEAALPPALRQRLDEVKEETAREQL